MKDKLAKIDKNSGRLAAGIVFTDGKHILLLKRNEKGGSWSIPGGRAEKDESPLEAAKRESKEECGSCDGERFDHFYRRYGSQNFHTFLFAVKSLFDVKISDEHKDYRWVPLKDIEDMNLHPKFRQCLKVIFDMIKKRFPTKVSFLEWICEKNNL